MKRIAWLIIMTALTVTTTANTNPSIEYFNLTDNMATFSYNLPHQEQPKNVAAHTNMSFPFYDGPFSFNILVMDTNNKMLYCTVPISAPSHTNLSYSVTLRANHTCCLNCM